MVLKCRTGLVLVQRSHMHMYNDGMSLPGHESVQYCSIPNKLQHPDPDTSNGVLVSAFKLLWKVN